MKWCRWHIAFAFLMLASCARRAGRPTPIVCPIDIPSDNRDQRIRIDNPPPTSLVNGAYTLVVDGHIAAVYQAPADSVLLVKAWDAIDLATVQSIEVLRAPRAAALYPSSVGNVVRITRCYSSASPRDRPNVR